MAQTIYTVGHNSLNFMQFITLIQANTITHVVDIRSIPYSKYAPWSDKSRLPELLRPFKINYTYLGHKLGGKKLPFEQTVKQQGTTTQDVYDQGIQILLQLSMRGNLTLLCAEGDPAKCHRQHIIAQTLLDTGTKVLHILKDGAIKEAWKEDKPSVQPNLF
jgi:uncharacterized protein (DUF488 family)